MSGLYACEDPWRSQDLCPLFRSAIEEALQKRSDQATGLPVLDAGGGEGWFYDSLKPERYHLLDINAEALLRAKKRISTASVQFIQSGLDDFKVKQNTYGAIWLFNVLSYLGGEKYSEIVRRIIKNLWDSLAPGGVFLLLCPYYCSLEKEKLLYASNWFDSDSDRRLILQKDYPGTQQSFLFLAYQKRP